MAPTMTIFNETSHEWWQIRLRINTHRGDVVMVLLLEDCDDWILSNTINNNNLVRPECTDDNRCCINQGAMGSMINTTFGWGDDDNIGTSHDVLLFGDQHETFGTTVIGV